MKINPCEKRDLRRKTDYPTAGWLNQNHDLLQGMGLEKINPAGKQSDYATDIVSYLAQINPILLGAAGQGFTLSYIQQYNGPN